MVMDSHFKCIQFFFFLIKISLFIVYVTSDWQENLWIILEHSPLEVLNYVSI